MPAPLTLLILSLTGLAASFATPELLDLRLPAALIAGIALLLVLRARRGGRPGPRLFRRRWIILDGSNIMHWSGDGPDLKVVRQAIKTLTKRGFTPSIVFDANVGYKLAGRYQNETELAKLLGLPVGRVFVVAKGTPADEVILSSARELRARIVTNDRFRDWAEAHPEVKRRGHLVRGGYRAGKVWVDLPKDA